MVGTVQGEIQLIRLFAIPYVEMGRMLSLRSVMTPQMITKDAPQDAQLFIINGTVFEGLLQHHQFAPQIVGTAIVSTMNSVMTVIKTTLQNATPAVVVK